MDKQELIQNIRYLVDKYLDGRSDLVELLMEDSDSVKYILSEINSKKYRDYEDKDLDMIKDIAFWYL